VIPLARDNVHTAAIVANIVALLALLVSTLGTLWNWRAIKAQEHARLEPRFDLAAEMAAKGVALRIICRGPMDYDSVRFQVVASPNDNREPVRILHGGQAVLEADLGPMTMGQTEQVLMLLEGDEPRFTMHVVLTCTNSKGTWRVPLEWQSFQWRGSVNFKAFTKRIYP
jgi:hypothetical protein